VDFVHTYSAGDLEHVCVRIDAGLHTDLQDLDEHGRIEGFRGPRAGNPPRVAKAGETLLWWILLVAVWISTLNSVTAQELVVASVAGLACALVATSTRGAYRGSWKLSRAWSLPLAVVRDCATLFSRDAAVRRVPLRPKEKAVKTLIVSAAPGTVVLDDKGQSLLVHALGREARR
jgi:multisubunit Na+/H+ antiporter MnhE subunit